MRITSYTVELQNGLNVLVKENAVNYKQIITNNPLSIVEMMNDIFGLNRKAEEYVYMIGLNTKCAVIGVFMISKGTVSESMLNPRDIFVRLFLCGASTFVILHNHPSGDPTPSSIDINITNRIKDGAKLMGLKFIDHIIIGDNYYSFHEHGYLS